MKKKLPVSSKHEVELSLIYGMLNDSYGSSSNTATILSFLIVAESIFKDLEIFDSTDRGGGDGDGGAFGCDTVSIYVCKRFVNGLNAGSVIDIGFVLMLLLSTIGGLVVFGFESFPLHSRFRNDFIRFFGKQPTLMRSKIQKNVNYEIEIKSFCSKLPSQFCD